MPRAPQRADTRARGALAARQVPHARPLDAALGVGPPRQVKGRAAPSLPAPAGPPVTRPARPAAPPLDAPRAPRLRVPPQVSVGVATLVEAPPARPLVPLPGAARVEGGGRLMATPHAGQVAPVGRRPRRVVRAARRVALARAQAPVGAASAAVALGVPPVVVPLVCVPTVAAHRRVGWRVPPRVARLVAGVTDVHKVVDVGTARRTPVAAPPVPAVATPAPPAAARPGRLEAATPKEDHGARAGAKLPRGPDDQAPSPLLPGGDEAIRTAASAAAAATGREAPLAGVQTTFHGTKPHLFVPRHGERALSAPIPSPGALRLIPECK